MLTDLEARWRDERTPQAGVRLAEALQQQGERIRAEGILAAVEARLESEPRDLASRVAVGGMRLALGQPADAARVLEQVVQADPTHLKANKLLVEVYLELDQRDRARDRLDLYRLLNEGDPEIEKLEGLLVGTTAPASAIGSAPGGGRRLSVGDGDPFSALVTEPPPVAEGDVFLELAPPPPPESTATLGALYQEQGHHEEAERIFREIVAEEPGSLPAREGLAALAGELEADAGPVDAEEPAPAPVVLMKDLDPEVDRERRIGILRDYLARIQRGREVAAP